MIKRVGFFKAENFISIGDTLYKRNGIFNVFYVKNEDYKFGRYFIYSIYYDWTDYMDELDFYRFRINTIELTKDDLIIKDIIE